MRHFVLLIACCLAFSVSKGDDTSQTAAELFRPRENAPLLGKLDFDGSDAKATFETGTIVSGIRNYFRVDIQNQTDSRVVIEKMDVSCGCMAAMSQSPEISPGATSSVFISLSSDKPGKFGKPTKITIDDGNLKSVITVTVAGTAKEFYSCKNTVFSDPAEGSLAIEFIRNFPDLKELKPRLGSDQLSFEFNSHTGDSSTFKIKDGSWSWSERELSRLVPVWFCEGEEVVQTILLKFVNPKAIVVRPTEARPTEQTSTQQLYKFYVNGSAELIKSIGKVGGLELRLNRRSQPEVFARIQPSEIKELGREMLVVSFLVSDELATDLAEASWCKVETGEVLAESILLPINGGL